MAGVINFVASDFLENTTGTGDSEFNRQSSYSYSKDSFKKMWYRRHTINRDSSMTSSVGTATTSPIQLTVGVATTTSAGVVRGQTLTLAGVGGSLGTVRSLSPDASLTLAGTLGTNQLILNSLSQDLPASTKLFF